MKRCHGPAQRARRCWGGMREGAEGSVPRRALRQAVALANQQRTRGDAAAAPRRAGGASRLVVPGRRSAHPGPGPGRPAWQPCTSARPSCWRPHLGIFEVGEGAVRPQPLGLQLPRVEHLAAPLLRMRVDAPERAQHGAHYRGGGARSLPLPMPGRGAPAASCRGAAGAGWLRGAGCGLRSSSVRTS